MLQYVWAWDLDFSISRKRVRKQYVLGNATTRYILLPWYMLRQHDGMV